MSVQEKQQTLIIWVLTIGCSSNDPEPPHWNLATSFFNSEGKSLFEDPNYDQSLIKWSPGEHSWLLFKECEEIFVLPGVNHLENYIDFGNGDIDTINYKWEGGDTTVPQVNKLDWLEVYYNQKLVKKWEFSNYNERSDFSARHCPEDTCPTDCTSPDVIEIIKN